MTERFIELPERGVTLCAASGGAPDSPTGRPLVVLNGTGSDLRNRPNALEWSIAEQFHVLTHDHRCLGRSEQHDPDHQPDMADFALDALALCDAQGVDDFDLIGISFGGMVAQEVAIRAPDRVASLVLCCTSSGGGGGSSFPLHDLYAEGRRPVDVVETWDTRAADDPEMREQIVAWFEGRARSPEPPPGLLRQIEARRTHDTWDRLPGIEADTLVAYGEFDGVAPPSNSEAIARRVPNAELAAFSGGHMFLWQDRTAWPHIIDFLVN